MKQERRPRKPDQKTFRRMLRIMLCALSATLVCLFAGTLAFAQSFPSSIDAGRITTPQEPIGNELPRGVSIRQPDMAIQIPEQARDVRFTLRGVQLSGVSEDLVVEIQSLYADRINREISVADIWGLAREITNYYHSRGFFLSRAYVPEQEIEGGIIHIKIAEGYFADIELEGTLSGHPLIQAMMTGLVALRPARIENLEAFMLRLNDLGGYRFFGVLQPYPSDDGYAVKLVIKETQPEIGGSISVDNYGSSFLGPYRAFATVQGGVGVRHVASLTVGSDLGRDEIRYIETKQGFSITDRAKFNIEASHVRTQPGASLRANDIESDSSFLSLGLSYQPIRQRYKNLSFYASIDGRNSNGDFLDNNPLTRDRVRALRVGGNYDFSDGWDGYNYLTARLSQGLGILGSSEEGDANLSRSEARTDFFYVNASYTRQQILPSSLMLVGQVIGQYSEHALYSSEEFGYGGAGIGRAYDSSEILGDSGLASQIELRYTGFALDGGTTIIPYIFYDIGKVWNRDSGGDSVSAASAGFGARFQHPIGVSGHAGVAFPLTKPAENPIYGNEKSPRFLFQFSYTF